MLFADVIGHDDLKKRLIQSVQESRVSHAQLFLGPEGSGKMPLALVSTAPVSPGLTRMTGQDLNSL